MRNTCQASLDDVQIYTTYMFLTMPGSAPPNRRDRKRLRTLEQIARAAASLFEVNGYEGVTMEQIATAADVAKGTLYNHFPVKEAVLAYWLHLEMAGNLEQLHAGLSARPGFAQGALYVLKHSAAWCEEHPHYLAPYLRFRFLGIGLQPSPAQDSERLSDVADTFLWLVRRAQESGEIRHDLDASRLALAFHHLYLGAMLRWLADSTLNLRTEFAAAVDLFLHGASSSAPATHATSRRPRRGAS